MNSEDLQRLRRRFQRLVGTKTGASKDDFVGMAELGVFPTAAQPIYCFTRFLCVHRMYIICSMESFFSLRRTSADNRDNHDINVHPRSLTIVAPSVHILFEQASRPYVHKEFTYGMHRGQ